MTEINEKGFTKLFNNAVERLDRIITSDEITDDDKIKVKACQSVIGAYPRFRQAQADIARVTMSVIKETSETEEQYRQILKAHLPRISPLISLPQVIDSNRQTVSSMQDKVTGLVEKHQAEVQALKNDNDELRFKIMQLEENKQ